MARGKKDEDMDLDGVMSTLEETIENEMTDQHLILAQSFKDARQKLIDKYKDVELGKADKKGLYDSSKKLKSEHHVYLTNEIMKVLYDHFLNDTNVPEGERSKVSYEGFKAHVMRSRYGIDRRGLLEMVKRTKTVHPDTMEQEIWGRLKRSYSEINLNKYAERIRDAVEREEPDGAKRQKVYQEKVHPRLKKFAKKHEYGDLPSEIIDDRDIPSALAPLVSHISSKIQKGYGDRQMLAKSPYDDKKAT